MARALHRMAARAGLADFSARHAVELVARAIVRPHHVDVLSMLAEQQDPDWREPLDSVGANELAALERAVRRAAIRDGEPARRGGRRRKGARTPPETRPDLDLGAECKARDLDAMSDGLDVTGGSLDALVELVRDELTAAVAEGPPIESSSYLPS